MSAFCLCGDWLNYCDMKLDVTEYRRARISVMEEVLPAAWPGIIESQSDCMLRFEYLREEQSHRVCAFLTLSWCYRDMQAVLARSLATSTSPSYPNSNSRYETANEDNLGCSTSCTMTRPQVEIWLDPEIFAVQLAGLHPQFDLGSAHQMLTSFHSWSIRNFKPH